MAKTEGAPVSTGQPPTLEERFAALASLLEVHVNELRLVESALARIITTQQMHGAILVRLIPMLQEIETRFMKDGKLKFPGIFG